LNCGFDAAIAAEKDGALRYLKITAARTVSHIARRSGRHRKFSRSGRLYWRRNPPGAHEAAPLRGPIPRHTHTALRRRPCSPPLSPPLAFIVKNG